MIAAVTCAVVFIFMPLHEPPGTKVLLSLVRVVFVSYTLVHFVTPSQMNTPGKGEFSLLIYEEHRPLITCMLCRAGYVNKVPSVQYAL